MFNLFKSQKPDHYITLPLDDDYIIEENVLRTIYKKKLQPLEEHYLFNEFHLPRLEDADFVTSPMLLISGDITAKRKFIRQITNVDISSIQNDSDQPFDECFNAIVFGEDESTIPGSMLVFDSAKPFRPLTKFGLEFLNHFQGMSMCSPLLKTMSIIDTPNVLKKDASEIETSSSDDSAYDLTPSFEWFCQRADRILLFYNAHNLIISDIQRQSIEMYPAKIVIVLDNTDMNQQQLIKVYGTLMFTLAKIVTSSAEVTRVYIGSLCDHQLRYPVNGRLFRDERKDFFKELNSVASSAAYSQLNTFLERARLAKVHAYIIGEIHNEMRSVWKKERKKLEICKNLQMIFDKVQRDRSISADDFPELSKMQISLQHHDFSKFNSLKPELVELFDDKVVYNITQYMNKLSVID